MSTVIDLTGKVVAQNREAACAELTEADQAQLAFQDWLKATDALLTIPAELLSHVSVDVEGYLFGFNAATQRGMARLNVKRVEVGSLTGKFVKR